MDKEETWEEMSRRQAYTKNAYEAYNSMFCSWEEAYAYADEVQEIMDDMVEEDRIKNNKNKKQ